MKRLVSYGNVLASRRWHGLRKGSGFLWPARAVSFSGYVAFECHSTKWAAAFHFTLADGNGWYYVTQLLPTNADLFPLTIRMQNFVSYTGNVGAFGVGANALGFPIVYDKFNDSQYSDWLSTH